MTTVETEAEPQENSTEVPLPDPPPVPSLPAAGPKREQVLRSYAEKTVDRLGATATLWLIAELEEALADAREPGR